MDGKDARIFDVDYKVARLFEVDLLSINTELELLKRLRNKLNVEIKKKKKEKRALELQRMANLKLETLKEMCGNDKVLYKFLDVTLPLDIIEIKHNVFWRSPDSNETLSDVFVKGRITEEHIYISISPYPTYIIHKHTSGCKCARGRNYEGFETHIGKDKVMYKKYTSCPKIAFGSLEDMINEYSSLGCIHYYNGECRILRDTVKENPDYLPNLTILKNYLDGKDVDEDELIDALDDRCEGIHKLFVSQFLLRYLYKYQ